MQNMEILKKLGKYFLITFAITLVCAFIAFANLYGDIGNDAFDVFEPRKAWRYCFILGAMSLTALATYSLGIATLLAFGKLRIRTWGEFARRWAVGLLLVIPLSALVYACDWFVYPPLKKTFTLMTLETKFDYPQEIADRYDISKSEILENMPMVMPKEKIDFTLDSLKLSFNAHADTCRMHLYALPDTMAAEAYNSYHLGAMGIEYGCSPQPAASEDSLRYLQKILLYRYADQAWDAQNEIQQLAKECSKRTNHTIGLYLSYLLSALVVFLLRYKAIKKILAITAVLIVLSYAFKQVGELVEEYAQDTRSISKKVNGATRRAIFDKQMEERKERDGH